MDDVRFAPVKAEGLPEVSEVAVFPDRVEVRSSGRWVVLRFADFAERQRSFAGDVIGGVFGRRSPPRLVGERWGLRFRLFSKPKLEFTMPEEPGTTFGNSDCWKMQRVMSSGGYSTWDMT